MMQAVRKFLGCLGLPIGRDVDPVQERLNHHDAIIEDLASAIRVARHREDNPVTQVVRGTRHRPTTPAKERT